MTNISARFLFTAVITFAATNNPLAGSDDHHFNRRTLEASSSTTTAASLLQVKTTFGKHASADAEFSSKAASKSSNAIRSAPRRLQAKRSNKKAKKTKKANRTKKTKNPKKTTSAPTTSAPATLARTTSAPTKSAPTTSAPTISAPTDSSPTTSSPTISAPTNSMPSLPPTTEAFWFPPVIAEFGMSRIEACEGDDVKVVWKGYHNIQETSEGKCDSEEIGEQISEYQDPGYEETYTNNELAAAPGQTRYFKCSSHCGENANRIEVLCSDTEFTGSS